MTTTDDNLTENKSTATSESQEDDEPMGTIAEENSLANKFGASKHDDDDDWGEFAEDDDEQEQTKKDNTKVEDEKPKYTFGASSGFGTKGWAATHQTIPTPSKQPTFGGFGSSSGFGGFKSSSNDSLLEKKESTSAPSFGSFAKATASPFAAAAAAGNALLSSSSTNADSPNSSNSNDNTTTAAVEFVGKSKQESNGSESDGEDFNNNEAPAFGEGAKVKVPGVVQTKVKTGEEDEDTIYQTKAKLLVLDTASSVWKERGVGTFRINMKEEETKKVLQTRLVMRTDSVYRVILNLLLFEGMKVFIMQDKFVRFAGFETETKEDGTTETRLTSFALRCSNPSVAKEVCEQIISCIPPSHDENDTKA